MLYIISGTFDPLHRAHLGIAEYLESVADIPSENIFFEISTIHCDKVKHSLSYENRYLQFNKVDRRVISTPCPTFLEKLLYLNRRIGEVFPEHKGDRLTFCMGEDTFDRFTSEASYFGSTYERNRALNSFRENKGTALVLPRGQTKMIKNNGRWEFAGEDKKMYGARTDGKLGQFVQFVGSEYKPSVLSSSGIRNGNNRRDLLGRS